MSHCRTKHGHRSDVNQYVGKISVCPVCKKDFHSRLRLLAHLSESRHRSKKIHGRRLLCKDAITSGMYPKVPAAELQEAIHLDRQLLREARRAGRSHVIATCSVKRMPQSVIEVRPTKRLRTKASCIDLLRTGNCVVYNTSGSAGGTSSSKRKLIANEQAAHPKRCGKLSRTVQNK
eukprot:38773-Karenia_brevis.AAC.1